MRLLALSFLAIMLTASTLYAHSENNNGPIAIYVSNSGSDTNGSGTFQSPYKTIQHAVNSANNNDSIFVKNGVYEEVVVIDSKSLLLFSNFYKSSDIDDVNNTIIKGNTVNHVIEISGHSASEVLINGFTIKNGGLSGVHANRNTSILNSIIHNNTNYGIKINHAILNVENSKLFNNNTAIGDLRATVNLKNSEIYNNNTGVSFYNDHGGVRNIINSIIYDNYTGIYNRYAGNLVNVYHSNFVNNNIAIQLVEGSIIDIYNSIFVSNLKNIQTWAQGINRINIDYNIIQNGINSIDLTTTTNFLEFGDNNLDLNIEQVFFKEETHYSKVKSYSPAIGSGTLIEEVNVDFFNNPRPNPTDSKPDIGVYEHILAGALPSPLTLSSPNNDANNIILNPVMSWSRSKNTDNYNLQISPDSTFSSSQTTVHQIYDTSFVILDSLDYDTRYYWRVNAVNEYGSTDWSEIWSFTTRPELPEPIVLVSPGKDAINVQLMPVFTWREDFIANTYDFQLSGSDDFSDLLVDAQELSDTTLTIADSLDYLTNYYWRVRGIGELGEGEWSDAWAFTTIIEKPEPVALASPDSGATDISIEPLLTWIASERAEYYRIILATDVAFEAMVEDSSGIEATSFSPKTLSYNTDYFWKVKAINVGGESEWSETWSFFTEYALDTPELVSPDDQADELPLPVTFYWQPVEDAKNYELQVARDEDFENLLDISRPEGLAKQANTNQEAQAQDWNISQKVESLDYSTQYFWRVRATGNEGISDWSQARSLTTEDAPITDPVVLSSPADESTDVAFPVTLEWEAFDDADHYEVQLSKEVLFLDRRVLEQIEGSRINLTDLSDTTTYFWRVRATVDDQKTAWSEVWSFTTGYAIDAITAAPDLVTPEDGALRQPLSLYLLWHGVPDAEGYQVEVARESDFEELVYPAERSKLVDGANSVSSDNISIADSKYALHIEGLDHDQTYYWRVRGINAQGDGSWSEVWSFNTKRETDTSPELLSPANESEDLEMPVRLAWNEYDQADHYDLEVAVSPSFDSTLSYRSLTATSFDIAVLSDTTRYFWRVRATVDEQKTAWSQVWTFTTELRVPDIPVWEPQDGQSDVELTPLLVWGASDRAVMYDLQLSDDQGFSNLIIDESELPDTEYQVTGELEKGVRYYWKVRAGNQSGYSEWSDVLSFVTVAPTSMEQDELPISYELQQNYPNPFNPSTQLRFALPQQSHVRLTVYNMLGQQVGTLLNETRPAGWHNVIFDATGLSSGVFIYRLEAGGYVETKSMMFVK